MLRRLLRAVILDFDGLIVDTETPVFEAWRETYARHGQPLTLDVWQHALGTHGGFDPCAHLEQLLGRSLDCAALRAATRGRNRANFERLPLLPGVERLVDATRARGLRLGVASSSSCGWVTGWLERHDLHSRIGAVCARDDVERVKPDPELYQLTARRLGVDPAQCLVFEDSPNGVRAARAAGMRCVVVRNAITRPLEFPEHDAELASLEDLELDGLAASLGFATPLVEASAVAESP